MAIKPRINEGCISQCVCWLLIVCSFIAIYEIGLN